MFSDHDDLIKRVMNMYSSNPSEISSIHLTIPTGENCRYKSPVRFTIVFHEIFYTDPLTNGSGCYTSILFSILLINILYQLK